MTVAAPGNPEVVSLARYCSVVSSQGTDRPVFSFDMDDRGKRGNQRIGFPGFELETPADQSGERAASSVAETLAASRIVRLNSVLNIDGPAARRVSHHVGAPMREHHEIPSSQRNLLFLSLHLQPATPPSYHREPGMTRDMWKLQPPGSAEFRTAGDGALQMQGLQDFI